eukprot:708645-Prorocentrum_minimum.AAC.4
MCIRDSLPTPHADVCDPGAWLRCAVHLPDPAGREHARQAQGQRLRARPAHAQRRALRVAGRTLYTTPGIRGDSGAHDRVAV